MQRWNITIVKKARLNKIGSQVGKVIKSVGAKIVARILNMTNYSRQLGSNYGAFVSVVPY